MKIGNFIRPGLTACIATFALGMQLANALPFELEGNAVWDENAPEDWETLYAGGANNGGTPIAFTEIINDEPDESGNDSTIFTGGRKDTQPISQWKGTTGTSPDKDEITNAYAAAYKDDLTNDDLIIYFGADRISNKGDAFIGFWFFKNTVSVQNGVFSGEHSNSDIANDIYGDVLVLANFPQKNNAVPEVKVVVWDTSCERADNNNPQEMECDAPNLRLIKKVEGVCSPASEADGVCAITNSEEGVFATTNSPWPYQSKNHPDPDVFPYETFFEGGINITQLFGEAAGCFSSFMAETRSSSSFSATLKDYVLDDFNLCQFKVDKRCKVTELNPENNTFNIAYEIDVINSGAGPFSSDKQITIIDRPSNLYNDPDGTFTITGTLGALGDGTSLEKGEKITISGTYSSTVNGGNNKIESATLKLGPNEDDKLNAKNEPLTVACDDLELTPLLDVQKSCELSLEAASSGVVIRKEFTVDVCNYGEVPLSVSLTDSKLLSYKPTFDLDFPVFCEVGVPNSCDSGEECTMIIDNETDPDVYACQYSEGENVGQWVEAVPGGAGICFSDTVSYNPTEMPQVQGEDGSNVDDTNPANYVISNVITAEATSPVLDPDEGDVLLTETASATCQLCPTCPEGENCP